MLLRKQPRWSLGILVGVLVVGLFSLWRNVADDFLNRGDRAVVNGAAVHRSP